MSIRFEPMLNRVLVEELPDEAVSPGGIVIPDTAQESQRFRKCRVAAVGPGPRDNEGNHIKMTVSVDDIIYVGRFIMENIEIAGKKFGLIHENDIFGRLVDENDEPTMHAFQSDRSGKNCILCRQSEAAHTKKRSSFESLVDNLESEQ
jgi:chaperonin GroES